MAMTEIEKLKEKVAKDPNSRLFVPLAEEYRKEGMMDEAIEVLQKGLEKHPGYMSARVSLGKIYHAKGQMDESRIEFESVIKSIPDNLYAHKKLAEIYMDTGKKDLAIKAFRTVLKLNPMDEETLKNLQALEGAHTDQHLEKKQESGASSAKEAPSDAMVLEQSTHNQPNVEEPIVEGPKVEQVEESLEEMDAFKESLFGMKAEAAEEILEEIPAAEDDVSTEAKEQPEEAEKKWSFGEVPSVSESEGLEEEGITEIEEIPEEAEDEWSFGDVKTAPASEAVEKEVSADDVVEIQEETAEDEWSFGDLETAPGNEAVEEEVSADDVVEIPEEAAEELSFGDIADVLKTEGLEAAAESEKIPEAMFTSQKDESLKGGTAELTSGEAAPGSQKDKGLLLQDS